MLFKFTPYGVLYLSRRANTPVLTVIQKNILPYASDSRCDFKNENYAATEAMPYKQQYTQRVKVITCMRYGYVAHMQLTKQKIIA